MSGSDDAPFKYSHASELHQDVALDPAAIEVESAQPLDRTPAERLDDATASLSEHRAKQAQQNTVWRQVLFWTIVPLVVVLIVLNAAAFVVFLVRGDTQPAVLATWFAASVAQVIGLLMVITRHLFPGHDGQ